MQKKLLIVCKRILNKYNMLIDKCSFITKNNAIQKNLHNKKI